MSADGQQQTYRFYFLSVCFKCHTKIDPMLSHISGEDICADFVMEGIQLG